tara:strand:+ start:262 stop:534 length:273 start_codon:yes stop_codon:yes gene_type:complete
MLSLAGQDVYVVYGITDCPACLRACADLMEFNLQYVFVETDFSKSYRKHLKEKFNWPTFPIVIRYTKESEELVGGYDELKTRLNKEPPSD